MFDVDDDVESVELSDQLHEISKDDLIDWNVLSKLECATILSLPIDDSADYLKSAREKLKQMHARRATQLQDVARAYRASSDELPPGVVRSARVFITSKRRYTAW